MAYDAIVIGGGFIGLRVAEQLGTRGVRTLLIERATLGSGNSSRGVGGIRQQFATAINIALSKLSLPTFIALGERIGFQQNGYLYLALSENTHTDLQRRVDVQRTYGVPVDLLDPGTLREHFPYLQTFDVMSAAMCLSDGYANPSLALAVYTEQARAAGVHIREDTTVTGIRTVGHHVTGVETDAGSFAAAIVVNAAGSWAAQVAALVGLDLPVQPLKRQVCLTEPTNAVPATAPMIVDSDTGWHFRPQDNALLLAMAGGEQFGETTLELDAALTERMLLYAYHRLPGLTAGLAHGRAGYYAVTPDAHPILGPVESLSGFYLACGFSGHGFMHSPAVGMVLAAEICGESPAVDIAPLRLSRFARGTLLGDGAVL